MRLFIAINFTPDFLNALSEIQYNLKAAKINARYTPVSNMHMTLAFIGEWEDNIAHILPPVEKPFNITLSHIGTFHKTGILWAGVNPSQPLENLAHSVRRALYEAGIPFDKKTFTPHITLARNFRAPESDVLSNIQVPKASMLVSSVSLYKSELGKNGPNYIVLGRT